VPSEVLELIIFTGWPVSGPASGAAQPSVANAKTYWNQIACKAFSQYNTFWYVYQDYNQSPSFGVFNKAGKSIYDLAAC
jgi:glucan endo-1,3-beta-D-glucosidase